MWMQQQGRGAAARHSIRIGGCVPARAPAASPLPAYDGPWLTMDDGRLAKPAVALDIAGTDADALERVRDALFIASQGPTGRSLLEAAQRHGYTLALDDGYLQGIGATAMCDPGTRTVFLNGSRTAVELANALDHECAHVVQNAHPLFANQLPYTPVSLIARSRATEAEAIALEVQCAYERAVGDAALGIPGAPANGYTRDDGLSYVKGNQPAVATAWLTAVDLDPAAATSGKALARAHEAFYALSGAMDYYEDATLRWIESWGEGIAAKDRLRVSYTGPELRDALSWHGQPYLAKHSPALDPMDSAHAGLSQRGVERVRAIQAQRPAEPNGWWLPQRDLVRAAASAAPTGTQIRRAPAVPAPV